MKFNLDYSKMIGTRKKKSSFLIIHIMMDYIVFLHISNKCVNYSCM